MNMVPNMALHCSGYSIDSIPAADPNETNLERCTTVYQSITGYINWLAQYMHPDGDPVLTYLATYNIAPNHQHCMLPFTNLNIPSVPQNMLSPTTHTHAILCNHLTTSLTIMVKKYS